MANKNKKLSTFELVWYILCALVVLWGLTYICIGVINHFASISALNEFCRGFKNMFKLSIHIWGSIIIFQKAHDNSQSGESLLPINYFQATGRLVFMNNQSSDIVGGILFDIICNILYQLAYFFVPPRVVTLVSGDNIFIA